MRLFLDCDGVLADFEGHATEVFGMPPGAAEKAMGSPAYWKQLELTPDFYRTMPLMPDAKFLFESVKELGFVPTILTGCPMYWNGNA